MAKQTKTAEDVLSLFEEAAESHEVFELKRQVEDLQAEVTNLRSTEQQSRLSEEDRSRFNQTIEELREQLKATDGVVKVPKGLIKPNPKQPRQTFTDTMIQEMAALLEEEGQLDPIILLPGNMLFDGECRWRAVTQFLPNWKTLDAVYLPRELTEEELHAKTLIAGIRNPLNDLDLAEALIQQCQYSLKLNQEAVVKAVRRASSRLSRTGLLPHLTELVSLPRDEQIQKISTFGLDQSEQEIFLLLLRFRRNPAAIDANVFPMLRLPKDLKNAIRQQGLGSHHAKRLQRLNGKNLELSSEEDVQTIRGEAIVKVIAEKMTVAEANAYVSELIAQKTTGTTGIRNQKVDAFIRSIKSLPIEDLETSQLKELLTALDEKTKELREFLD